MKLTKEQQDKFLQKNQNREMSQMFISMLFNLKTLCVL